MTSPVKKRSIMIGNHKTSLSLEDEFWDGLKAIARKQNITMSALVGSVDGGRGHGNLSSALRLFVLDHFRSRAAGASA